MASEPKAREFSFLREQGGERVLAVMSSVGLCQCVGIKKKRGDRKIGGGNSCSVK